MGIRTQTYSVISLASNSNALLFPKHSVFLLWASIQYFFFIASTKFVVVQSFKSYLTLCKPKDGSTPSSSVLHYLPEFAQIHIHWVGDAPDLPCILLLSVPLQMRPCRWDHSSLILSVLHAHPLIDLPQTVTKYILPMRQRNSRSREREIGSGISASVLQGSPPWLL